MERNVTVRIDLVLDEKMSYLDAMKAINKELDDIEKRRQRLAQGSSMGLYGNLLKDEINLLQKKSDQRKREFQDNLPLADASKRIRIEEEIWKVRMGRPHDVQRMVQQETLIREQEETRRQARYKAKFGAFGGMMRGVDAMTMGPFGYAAMSGMMLGTVGAAGGGALQTFNGAVRRAAGELGIIFIPAIAELGGYFNRFAGFIRDLNPTLKSTIGYVATYGLLVSGGMKIFSMAVNAISALGAAATVAAARIGISSGASAAATIGTAAGGAAVGAGGTAATGVGAAAGFLWPAAAAIGVTAEAHRIYNAPNKPLALLESGALGGTGFLGLYLAIKSLITGENSKKSAQGNAPAPIDFPFQSQQMDIFALKDQIQMESLRTPAQQADFELNMRALAENLNKFVEMQERAGEIIGQHVRDALRDMRL